MHVRVLMVGLVGFVSSCSPTTGAGMLRGLGTLAPGYGVSPEAVQTYCPSPEHFGERKAHYEAMLNERTERMGVGEAEMADIPRPGQDACEVLAMLGAPNEQNVHRSKYGESFAWWYRTRRPGERVQDPHIVTMEFDDAGVLRVARVTW